MNTFVGAEYVIANSLIALKKKGIDYITFSKLREIGFEIQNLCNTNGVDAIILTFGDSISSAIYDFSDYFQYREVNSKKYNNYRFTDSVCWVFTNRCIKYSGK